MQRLLAQAAAGLRTCRLNSGDRCLSTGLSSHHALSATVIFRRSFLLTAAGQSWTRTRFPFEHYGSQNFRVPATSFSLSEKDRVWQAGKRGRRHGTLVGLVI